MVLEDQVKKLEAEVLDLKINELLIFVSDYKDGDSNKLSQGFADRLIPLVKRFGFDAVQSNLMSPSRNMNPLIIWVLDHVFWLEADLKEKS